MSAYSPTKTIRNLAADGEIFSVHEVVRKGNKTLSKKQLPKAYENAGQILSTMYREGQLKRFGPVNPPESKTDFARLGAQIAYTGIDGPSEWQTPNGTFKALTYPEALELGLTQSGRKHGTNRDDSRLWTHPSDPLVVPEDDRSMQRQVEELQGQLRRANEEQVLIQALIDALIPQLRDSLYSQLKESLYQPLRSELQEDLADKVPEIVAERMLGVSK